MSISTGSLRRELLLNGLNKLDDRDTLKSAINELQTQIQELEVDSLAPLVTTLCRVDRTQKNFARRVNTPLPLFVLFLCFKESVRLFGVLASEDCPRRELFLSSHLLSKATRFLVHVFTDRDASVREASVETLAVIAKEWSAFSKQKIPGDVQNLFMKRIFNALAEGKREVQISASDALRMMSPYLGLVHKDLIRDALRHLKSPNFNAKANLIQALASFEVENEKPQGILISSLATFQPFLMNFLGQQESMHRIGHGLLHLISSSDWFTRKASADAFRAIAILVGPQLYKDNRKAILKIRERLQRQRFDRVKPVRDAIQQTIEIYEAISEGALPTPNEDMTAADAMSEASALIDQTEVDDHAIDGLSVVSEQLWGRDSDENWRKEVFDHTSISDSGMKESKRERSYNRGKRTNSSKRKNSPIPEDVMIYVPKSTPGLKNISDTGGSNPASQIRSAPQDLTQAVIKLEQRVDTLSGYLEAEIAKLTDSIKALHEKFDLYCPRSSNQSYGMSAVEDPSLSRPSTAASLSKMDDSMVQNQDLDVLYQRALTNQIDFFRILQKTGPVIPHLSLQTLNLIFEAFCWLLHERRGIARILPWFWQLTEQPHRSIAISMSNQVQERLLETFSEMNGDGVKEMDQIRILDHSLRDIWTNDPSESDDIFISEEKTVHDDNESLYATSYTTGKPYHDSIRSKGVAVIQN